MTDTTMVLFFMDELAKAIVREASVSAPADIANAMYAKKAIQSDDTFMVEVGVNLDQAPQAAAFEYGSGLHRTIGDKSKYKIAPKNAAMLAFNWMGHDPRYEPSEIPWRSPKFAGVQTNQAKELTGGLYFHWVEHPGIEARPYLRPAIENLLASMYFQNVLNAAGNMFKLTIINNIGGSQ